MIKSFRGRLDHGTSTQLRLSTNKGLIGYKIKKFECITQEPGGHNVEHVTKLFTVKIDEVTTPTAVVNFDNPLLLGVNYYRDGTSTERNTDETIIFDHTVFNQDIYICLCFLNQVQTGYLFHQISSVALYLLLCL